MSAYLKEPTTEVEAAARALFQRWKDRSARSIIPPQPGSYVLDVWENLPPSVTGDFYRDAEAALKAVAAVHMAEDGPLDEDDLSDAAYLRDLSDRLMRVPVMYGVDQGDVERLADMGSKLKARYAPVTLPQDVDEAIRDALKAALTIVGDRAAGGRMLTTQEQAKAALDKIKALLGQQA